MGTVPLGPGFHEPYVPISKQLQCLKICQTYLLGNSRLPKSFDGEPAPALPVPAWVIPLPSPFPSGYRRPDPAGGSSGELVPEACAERLGLWFMFSWPSPSRLTLKSGRVEGAIMDYDGDPDRSKECV